MNPARALVPEFFETDVASFGWRASRPGIYRILPLPLLLWHSRGPGIRGELLRAWLGRRLVHPLWYPGGDRTLRRWLYIQAALLNQYRKFARYYRPRRATMGE